VGDRLSRAGNRQINRVLHTMAAVQLRNPTEGRAYLDRKKASGKTSMEWKSAMRSLKRRLSDIVHRQMVNNATAATATGLGGRRGTTIDSSVTSSHPPIPALRTKSLPGPATTRLEHEFLPPPDTPESQSRVWTVGRSTRDHRRISAAAAGRRRRGS
jgi:transposase